MERYPFDDEYLRRLREGDPETEEHFDSFFRPLLRAKLRSQTLRGRRAPNDVVEDLIQEVLTRVIGKVRNGHVRDGRALGKFVFTVCRNVVLEYSRVPLAEQIDPTNAKHDPPMPEDDPEKALLKKERVATARRLVEGHERDTQILKAIYLGEQDKDEVCAEFDISRENLRVVLFRALKRLRDESRIPGGRPPRSGRTL
jgi:RNA polymerase sigma-70 factor, ECF subfamily